MDRVIKWDFVCRYCPGGRIPVAALRSASLQSFSVKQTLKKLLLASPLAMTESREVELWPCGYSAECSAPGCVGMEVIDRRRRSE